MRSNEERIAALHERAEVLNRQRKERIVQGLSFSFALILTAVFAYFVSGYGDAVSFDVLPGGMNAAMFAKGNALGYVFVAVVSFLLGTFVTVFCYYLKKGQGRNGR
ncbi:MAG: hypothetical protein K5648_03285 [Erysipelotrichaceae bacterium]|nr:hypothetical protein [Erysipelotrichaceae bacterium]